MDPMDDGADIDEDSNDNVYESLDEEAGEASPEFSEEEREY